MADLEDRPEFARRKWSPIVGDRLFWDHIASCKAPFDRLPKMIGVAEHRETTLGGSFGMLLELSRFLFIELDDTSKFIEIAQEA